MFKFLKNMALMFAANEGDLNKVKELLDKGANANAKYGDTALIRASWNGHTEIVEALVEAGADVNVKDENGNIALIWASAVGYIEIVKALIEAGADVDAEYEDGCTALTASAELGNTEVVETLLEAGAYVDVKNKDGNTALALASVKGHMEIVKALILAGGDCTFVTEECNELIMQYVLEVTQEQLSAGRTVNQEEVARISVNRASEVLMRKYGFSEAEVAEIVEISASR